MQGEDRPGDYYGEVKYDDMDPSWFGNIDFEGQDYFERQDELQEEDRQALMEGQWTPPKIRNQNFGSGLQNLLKMEFDPNSLTIPMIRVQVSLGSMVESIENVTTDGLTIRYSNGDRCRHSEEPTKYTSQILFICDLTSTSGESYDSDKIERPLLSKITDKCHYEFIWRTKNACRFCTHDDVTKELGECIPDHAKKGSHFNGYRHLFYKVKEGSNCVIREYASMVGHPADRDRMIVPGNTEIVKCNYLQDDLDILNRMQQDSPLLRYVYLSSALTIGLTFCGGLLICIRYCVLHFRVSELQNTVTRMYSEAGLPADYDYE